LQFLKNFPKLTKSVFGKVFASIADQATASSANFGMNVLLARWLTRSDYGAFSVAWSFCLVFTAFHNAVILEPMTIVGPAEYGSGLARYLQTVRKLNWYAVAALGLLASLTGFFYQEIQVKHALYALGLCLPGYLLLLTMRREQYVLNRPIQAFQMSLVYTSTLACILAILRWKNYMSELTGLICIGAALPVALWAGTRRATALGADADQLNPVTRAHWTYGKWLLASSILAVGIPDVQVILLSRLVDLQSAGALRAMMNFIQPLLQLMTVSSVYALPGLARRMKQSGTGSGLRHALFFPAAAIGMALLYVGVLIAAGKWLELLLYQGRMAQYITYLPLLGVAAVLTAVGMSFSTLLRAAQNSQHQLFAGMAGSVVGIGAAFLLLKPYGLGGAIAAMILANAASSLWIVITYVWMARG
jgi:O-antigen/teichoic acid export membrane protein